MFRYDRLDELVKERGKTKNYLSQRLGHAGRYLNDARKQNTKLDGEAVYILANELGTTYEYLMGLSNKKTAPSASDEAIKIAKRIDALDARSKGAVLAVLDYEESTQETVPFASPAKLIPLFGQSMAAGNGEPDMGAAFFDEYEVPSDSKADFACRVHGDSLEPYYEDGSIALAVKRQPEVGEVGAFLVDGEYKLKQFVDDGYGNIYLFALNRDRSDTDQTLWAREEHTIYCLGTVLMKRPPLPNL